VYLIKYCIILKLQYNVDEKDLEHNSQRTLEAYLI